MKHFKDFDYMQEEETSHIMPIFTEIKSEEGEGNEKLLDENDLPILALRNMVLFPGITMPVAIGRSKSLALVKVAQKENSLIGVVCQYDYTTDDPTQSDLYSVGVVAEILKVLELPDSTINVILQGKGRFKLNKITQTIPYNRGVVTLLDDFVPQQGDAEFEALVSSLKDLTFDMLKKLGDGAREMTFAVKNISDSAYLVNFL
ncbi:MAG: LON peptidase substrate-binding domain-containing protein, partial [Bacteroidales bacterium]|nr:LON peptidase substrate-binding domain-containing protein [Bacteroidales bacterium]